MPKKKPLPDGVDVLPSGKYRARVRWQGRQVTLGAFHSLTDATAALSIARGEIARGVFVPPVERRTREAEAAAAAAADAAAQTYTVGTLFEDWMKWQERRGLKDGTLYTRRSRWASRMEARWARVSVRDVTPADVTAWYDAIKAERPGAAREVLAQLSQMYSYATGTAAHLPIGHVRTAETNPAQITTPGRRKPIRKPHREIATPEEISSLASRMPEREQLAVLLAGWCTHRIGEGLGCRRRDFWRLPGRDGEPGPMFVRIERQVQTKGGWREDSTKSVAGTRDAPVPDALVPVVEAHLRDHVGLGQDAPVFPRTRRGVKAIHPNTLRDHFKAARDEHNADAARRGAPALDGFVFHDLRKTALTRAGRAGATGAELMRLGGHADMETVQIYQRADLDRLAALAETMSEDVVVPGGVAPVTDIRDHLAG